MSKRRAKRVARLLVAIHTSTRGQGHNWQAAKRAVLQFALNQKKLLRLLFGLRCCARLIMLDMLDGVLDGRINPHHWL